MRFWTRGDGLPVAALAAPSNAAKNRQVLKLLATAPDADLPAWLLADKSFDDNCLARRLKGRFVAKRSFAWLHAFRRLPFRHEYCSFMYADYVALACLVIVARNL